MLRKEFIRGLTEIYAGYMNEQMAQEEAETIARDYTDEEIENDGNELLREAKRDICAELQCAYYLGH